MAIRPKVAFVALAAALCVTLAACAPGGSTTKSAGGTVPLPKTTAKASIKFWGWEAAASAKVEIAAFNKVYPNIKVTYKQLDNSPKYEQELTPGLLSNAGPDVFMMPPGVDVNKYSSYTRDLTGLASESLGSGWKAKLSSLGISSMSTTSGKLVAAPTGSQSYGTWLVNTSLVSKLGLKVPTGQMSTSELISFCAKVNATGHTCLSIGGGVPALLSIEFQSVAESVAPGKYEEAVAGKIKWTDPGLVKALTLYQSLFKQGVFQSSAVSDQPYPDLWTDFMQQKAVMTVLGTWTLNMYTPAGLKTNLDSNQITGSGFNTLLIPTPDLGGSGSVPQLPTGTNSGDAINAKSKNVAAAEAYVAWKDLSVKGQQFVADQLIFQPNMKGIAPQGLKFVASGQEASLKDLYSRASSSKITQTISCPTLSDAVNNAMQQLATGTSPSNVASTLQGTAGGIDFKTCGA